MNDVTMLIKIYSAFLTFFKIKVGNFIFLCLVIFSNIKYRKCYLFNAASKFSPLLVSLSFNRYYLQFDCP